MVQASEVLAQLLVKSSSKPLSLSLSHTLLLFKYTYSYVYISFVFCNKERDTIFASRIISNNMRNQEAMETA